MKPLASAPRAYADRVHALVSDLADRLWIRRGMERAGTTAPAADPAAEGQGPFEWI